MDKKELEETVIELKIQSEANKRVRLRCAAFWSTVLTVSALIGGWCSSHVKPVKAAAVAFWDNL